MNNNVRCECRKKTFIKGYIYKLIIGPYYYIGLTDTTIKNRYRAHKSNCFNKRKKRKTELTYNSKVYKSIRKELSKITKKQISDIIQTDFQKYVLVKQVAVINTSRKDLKLLESQLINLNNDWCLNSVL